MSIHVTSKQISSTDADQVLRAIFNANDMTISTTGFVAGKVGHRIETEIISPTIDEYFYLDIVNTVTATITSASPIVTMANTVPLMVGQYVSLPIGQSGIPRQTTILSIDSGTQITLSASATASGSVTLRTANLLRRELVEYNNAGHDILLTSERVE